MDILTILSLGQTALELGLICSLTVLALFLSYTMLNVCDLSTDGCFTLGAAVGAAVALAGHPWLSLGAAMAAGICSGFIVAILQTRMGVNSLLAGIIVNTALYSINIAVMGGSKNDNSCYAVMQLLPVKRGGYIRNVMYIETCNGEHTVAQALRIRKLFQDFEGDYIVLDTQGAGIGVFDTLCRELVDDESGEIYPPVSCANDPVMASRCRDRNAPKVIYSIRANAQFNSDAALAFRDHIKRGLIRLLIDEEDAQEMFANDTAFMRLTTEEQSRVLLPYVQTSLFITETINLSYDILNGKVRIKETGTRRKDRYSSIMYADVVASELEKKYRRRYEEDAVSGDGDIPFVFRQPNLYGR